MKRYLVLYFMVIALYGLGAQTKLDPDSLMRIMPTVADTQKILNYFDICRYWVGVSKTKSIGAANAALDIAESMHNDRWIARSLNVLIATLNIHGEQKNIQALAEKSLAHALRSGSKTTVLGAYESLSNSYGLNTEWDKALESTDKCLALANEIKDTISILNAYNMYALCSQELKRRDTTEYYHKAAIVLSKKIGRNYELGRAYAGLSELYYLEARWEEAIENALLGAAAFHTMVYPIGEAQVMVIHAAALLQKGELEKSKASCNQILSLLKQAGNDVIEGEAKKTLGYIAIEQKNYELARTYFKEAEKVARVGGDYKLLKDIYRGQEILNSILGDFSSAKIFRQKFELASDTFFSEKILSNLTNYQVKYQTALKEQQIAKEKEKRNRIVLGSVIAFLLLISGFLYLRYKQRLLRQQTELEAKNALLRADLEHTEADRLREIDKLKSNFFANISHEFRTPLSLIISPLSQMINGEFQGDIMKYYRIMHRNAVRLLDLVNQLLDLSRLESGKMELTIEKADLNAHIKAVAFSFESIADKKNINLIFESDQIDRMVWFDKDMVEKIVSNLVSNAIKFSLENGQIIISTKEISRHPQHIEISVSDQGIGIPESEIPYLFERFSRSTVSEIQPGSGLGLALTKELVELHGGTLTVVSKESHGSVFKAVIATDVSDFSPESLNTRGSSEAIVPSTVNTNLEIETSSSVKAQSFSNSTFDKVILLVEDNSDVRTYLRDQLADQFQIIEAENGVIGLQKAILHLPDVIISDVMMPEMNGIELCTRIKTNNLTCHIPVIMLTAKAEEQDKLTGLSHGADDYLTKPFQATELRLKLKNLTERQQRLHEKFMKSLTSMEVAPVKAESMEAVFLVQVRSAIESNLNDETFSVTELATHVGLSRSQLHRKLSALTGNGPNDIIRTMRLARAHQLLAQRAGTVSEIAYRCGFNSPAYFVKCFKDQYGYTPGSSHT